MFAFNTSKAYEQKVFGPIKHSFTCIYIISLALPLIESWHERVFDSVARCDYIKVAYTSGQIFEKIMKRYPIFSL